MFMLVIINYNCDGRFIIMSFVIFGIIIVFFLFRELNLMEWDVIVFFDWLIVVFDICVVMILFMDNVVFMFLWFFIIFVLIVYGVFIL